MFSTCPWYPLKKCQNQARGIPWRRSGGLAHTGLGVRGRGRGGDGRLAVQGNVVQSLKWEAPLKAFSPQGCGSAGVGVSLSEEPGC